MTTLNIKATTALIAALAPSAALAHHGHPLETGAAALIIAGAFGALVALMVARKAR